MTAVCVVGELRTYNAIALRRTIRDLDPVRVDYYLVKMAACVNGIWINNKTAKGRKMCEMYSSLSSVHLPHWSSALHLEERSTCDSPLLKNSKCCSAAVQPIGYFQYMRSQLCIQRAFLWTNVSRVVRLRPDVVYEASSFKNVNWGCNRKGTKGIYSKSASDLLLIVTRSINPLKLALRRMESKCSLNKTTPHIPETLLKCPLIDAPAKIVRPSLLT